MRDPDMIDGTKLAVWQERDRLHIHLTDRDGETVAEWWDDDARAFLEDNGIRGADHASIVKVCRQVGIISNVVEVYSIDAMRDEGGWSENDIHWRRTYVNVPNRPRALFAWMRDRGLLSAESAGRVEWDSTMQWVCERTNHRPLFGIRTYEE